MHIRRASGRDAGVLSAISRDTFVETFGHLYAPDDLAVHLDKAYRVDAYAPALDELGCAAWLLEDDGGHAQGYAFVGPCTLPHAEVVPGDLELKRLYVRAALQGGGWGGRLFAQALDWMQANAPTALWLGVFSENEGAQRFYRRHGFDKVGEYLYAVGSARDREFIFRRPA